MTTAELEVWAYKQRPVTDSVKALGAIAVWGLAEDWSDWADAEAATGC